MKRFIAAACICALATLGAVPSGATGACADPTSGGEWRSYGQDLRNTRSQPAETVIDASNVGTLEPVWALSLAQVGMTGNIQVTPAVADGCVYVATTDGQVASFNADTGQLNWMITLDITTSGYGGRVIGSPAVFDGHVYIHANEYGDPDTGVGPALVSLDQDTGEVEWWTVLDSLLNAYINSSPVVFDGMVFSGIAGPESSPRARGGYALVDATTGEIITKRYTINDDDYAKGYAGASVWSTAAVDTATGYAYVGGGNPASKRVEHPFSNALLKIDVDPDRATFGRIVSSYKGNADAYLQALGNQPACETLGEHPDLQITGIWSAPCGQLDLDFGASPNLFTTEDGVTVVGALQKSGVYHMAGTELMNYHGATPVGLPCFACNAASAAVLSDQVFTAAVPPGQVVALDGTSGMINWAGVLADGLHFQPVSAANGVVYVIDGGGRLDAFDAATGVPLLRRSMSPDAGGATANALTSSSGVAIARGKVYAAQAKVLIAYGLPA